MAKTEREPLLVGIMLCMGSLVGIGLLLTMPAYDAWQQSQTKQQQLTTDIATLTSDTQLVDQDIQKLASTPNLPSDIFIRQSSPSDAKKNIKVMLDELIRTATQTGNQLISLLPSDAAATAAAATPASNNKSANQAGQNQTGQTQTTQKQATGQAGTTTSTPASTDTASTSLDGTNQTSSAVATPVVPTLQSFPYELAFRGTYEQVLNFLSKLNRHRELVEVTDIELKNEGGAQRQEYASTSPFNRAKPIALKMNLKLILEPQ